MRLRERHAEAGYNMVMLIVLITVMMIFMGMALPHWSRWIQREKEEELIFRGLQYAEAIRVFKNRFGRLPVRLEELIEVEPRSIRQLWKDPMTESGEWGLLMEAGQQAPPPNPGGGGGGRGGDGNGDGGPQPQPRPSGELVPMPQGEGATTIGPIAGVFSKNSDTSIKVMFGAQQYDLWRFSYQLFSAGGAVTALPQQGGAPAPFGLKAEWIGRPFREGITPPGTAPGAQEVPPPPGSDGRPRGAGGDRQRR